MEGVVSQLDMNAQALDNIQNNVMANIVEVLIQIQNNVSVDNDVLVLLRNIIEINVTQLLVAIQNNTQLNNQLVVQIQENVQVNVNAVVQIQNNINLLSVTISKQLDVVWDKLSSLHSTWPWVQKRDYSYFPDWKY